MSKILFGPEAGEVVHHNMVQSMNDSCGKIFFSTTALFEVVIV